jgi:hypothetical protein
LWAFGSVIFNETAFEIVGVNVVKSTKLINRFENVPAKLASRGDVIVQVAKQYCRFSVRFLPAARRATEEAKQSNFRGIKRR